MKALKSLSSKVIDVVGSVIGVENGDEKLELHRSRLNNLSHQMMVMKEAIGKHGKNYQLIGSSGAALSDLFTEYYSGSSRMQSSIPVFANAHTTIQSVLDKNMKEKLGWECLKLFDDWQEECNKHLENIKKTENARYSTEQLESKVSTLRAAKEKKLSKGQQLTLPEESTLTSSEEMLKKYQTALGKMRITLDDNVNKFLHDRHQAMDAMFVRLMELELESIQTIQNTISSFQPIIESYRKKIPLKTDNPSPYTKRAATLPAPLSGGVGRGNNNDNNNNNDDLKAKRVSVPAASVAKNVSNNNNNNGNNRNHHHHHHHKKTTQAESGSEESGSEYETDEEEEVSEDELDEKNKQKSTTNNNNNNNKSTNGAKSPPPTVISVSSPTAAPTPTPSSAAKPAVVDFLNFAGDNNSGNNNNNNNNSAPPSSKKSQPNPESLLNMFSAPSPSSAASGSSNNNRKESSANFDFDFSGGYGAGGGSRPASTPPTGASFDPLGSFNVSDQRSGATLAPPRSSIPSSQSHDDFDPLNANKRSKLDDIDEGDHSSVSSSSSSSLDMPDGDSSSSQWMPGELTDDKKHLLDEKLTAWEYAPGGVQKPILTLLSTLSSVVWPNSGWKAPNISELMDANGIKKWKMKAARCIHPDKQVSASPAQQYMSKRVFAAINSAYQKYSTQGQQQTMAYY